MPKGKPVLKGIVDAHFHRAGLSPEALTLVVRDRTTRAGTAVIRGPEIDGVRGGFVDLRDGRRVPVHRVVEVLSGGERVWPPG